MGLAMKQVPTLTLNLRGVRVAGRRGSRARARASCLCASEQGCAPRHPRRPDHGLLARALTTDARFAPPSRVGPQISKPLSKQIVSTAKSSPMLSKYVRAFGQTINRMTGVCACVSLCASRIAWKTGMAKTARASRLSPGHSAPLPSSCLLSVPSPPASRSVDAPCCGWVGHQQNHAGT